MASATTTHRSPPSRNPRATVRSRSTSRLGTVQTAMTLKDLLDQLGGIAPARIRLNPTPGTARQKDLLHARDGGSATARFELVDGVLVEKLPMGWFESILASVLAGRIRAYLDQNNIGVVSAGGDGYLKLKPNMIRVPDVAVVLWDRIPGRKNSRTPCPANGERDVLSANDDVTGEQVLPGFRLSIREWFQVAEDGTRPGRKK